MSTSFRFLPWVRRGAAAAITTVDTLGPGLSARTSLGLKVLVNQRVDVGVSLRLYGPGDVTGLDTRVVIRTDPPHLAADFEPNYFPSVELDMADLPWLLTPAAGDAQARLRPWICLIVVRKQPGVSLTTDRARPLPVLAFRPPARAILELPDLAESWAWAHGQVVSTDDTPVRDLLTGGGEPPVSRLVCPRCLRPGQSYFACVVPAFAAGRKAGLGELLDATDDQLTPAWDLAADPESLDLPVYFHWEFSTGREGDFESLVRRLRGQPVPDGVGERRLVVGDAAFGLPDAGLLPLEGTLRVPRENPQRAEVAPAFRDALRDLLNLPDTRQPDADHDPIVAPPIYGSWQTARRRLDDATPVWVRDANLDPRYRAAAGVGALVVQDQQEQLMAAAWEQLNAPDIAPRTNRKELGRAVLTRLHKRLAALAPEAFLDVTAPLHARVRLDQPGVIFSGQPPEVTPRTAREQIRRSRLPLATVSASFQRVTRPRGPLVSRAVPAATPAPQPLAFAARFGPAIAPVNLARALAPDSTVTAAAIENRLGQLVVLSTELGVASQFNAAVREVTGYLAAAVDEPVPPPLRPVLVFGQLQLAILRQIDPAAALPRAVEASRGGPAPAGSGPALAAAGDSGSEQGGESAPLPAPSFPQPMYEAMRDLAPDLLLPGMELVPPDSVTLLETNPPVIAAYMLGLNHEMSRELQWREYPSDLRATCFRRFWAGPAEMLAIHQWPADGALGAPLADGSGDEQIVLLIRGELLRRYPRTAIYAVPAIDRRTPGDGRQLPTLRAALAPDLVCLGFDLSADEARGSDGQPGWFFVIEQPTGHARFGLDESTVTGRDFTRLASWNNLAWGDMAASRERLDALTHAPVAGALVGMQIGKLSWGLNAGHMAAITLQRPVRVLQHAADLLPPEA